MVARGFPLMRAHFPRCFVDVNREPYELDPRMFEGRLPSFANTRSMRVAGGLGTVARVVGDAQEIYDQRIPVDDALAPHREPVQALSPRAAPAVHPPAPRFRRRRAGRLPFHALDRRTRRTSGRAPEFVLGDRYGTSCVGVVAETIEATLRGLGYSGQPQQALCRRLHHRALRQPGRRPARHPARDQPRALHGRAALRAFGELRAPGRPTSTRWRGGWARSRWRSCGPIARRPSSGCRQ